MSFHYSYRLPTLIQGSGFDQMCSDFNIGTESFDVCGGIVLRIGSAAFAGNIAVKVASKTENLYFILA